MSRNIADLKRECEENGINVVPAGKRESKTDYEAALRDFFWKRDHGNEEMLPQVGPMLGRNIKDVSEEKAEKIWSKMWVQEKINGCRGLFHVGVRGINRITSRRVSDQTYLLNENTDNCPHLRDVQFPEEWAGTVVDGELISPVERIFTEAISTRNVLQSTVAMLNCAPEKSIRIQKKFGFLKYMMFDMIKYKGVDISNQPYVYRYSKLIEFFEVCRNREGSFFILPILQGKGATVEIKKNEYEMIVKAGGEGVMLKDPQGTYEDSGRPDTMYKVKKFIDQDAFVTGWEMGEEGKGQAHLVATLIFGAFKKDSENEIVEVGKCSNFEIAEKEAWTLKGPATGNLMLDQRVMGRVYELRGQEWSSRNFRMVHCRAMSQRFDKSKEDCVVDIMKIKAEIEDSK